MILLGFPAELFNNTLQANYGRLRRVMPWIGSHPVGERALSKQVVALVSSCAVAGLIRSFQKVHEWTAETAIVTALAIAFGFFATVAVFEVAGAVAGARMGLPPRSFRSYPGALPIVAAFVGVSALGRLELATSTGTWPAPGSGKGTRLRPGTERGRSPWPASPCSASPSPPGPPGRS